MNQDRIRGGIKEAVGRVQDAAGGLMGDTRAQLNGKFRQAAGRAEGAYGDTLEALEGSVLERPLPALAVALAVGILVGLLAARRY
jgi:uncharacterized protein YjbJ (UPF0337 family)